MSTRNSEKMLNDIVLAGTADNTTMAHEKDLEYFQAWLQARFNKPLALPVDSKTITAFIADHLVAMPERVDRKLVEIGKKRRPGNHSVATVERRLASISFAHRSAGCESNPVRDSSIRLILSKAKASHVKKGVEPKRKKALTRKLLDKIMTTFGRSLVDKRDQAILLFAFSSGGRRRSEIAAARMDDLDRVRGGYLYHLAHSKTDQTGRVAPKPVRGIAAKALERWIKAAGITDGYLFRQIGSKGVTDKPIDPALVNAIVKRRVEMCGQDPAQYGAHSIRRGFITECGRQGVSLRDTMQLSGHRTVSIAIQYHEEGEVFRNPASNILEEGRLCRSKMT